MVYKIKMSNAFDPILTIGSLTSLDALIIDTEGVPITSEKQSRETSSEGLYKKGIYSTIPK